MLSLHLEEKNILIYQRQGVEAEKNLHNQIF